MKSINVKLNDQSNWSNNLSLVGILKHLIETTLTEFQIQFSLLCLSVISYEIIFKDVLKTTNHDLSGVLVFLGALVLVRWHDINSK